MPVQRNQERLTIMEIKKRLKHPVIFDGRNLFEPVTLKAIGIEYHGIGR